MKIILTNCELDPVTTFRSDLYTTPTGKVRRYCACNYFKYCLYHHFYEVQKAEGAVQIRPKSAEPSAKRPAKKGAKRKQVA